jgi:ATP-dependent Lhr-like helicase
MTTGLTPALDYHVVNSLGWPDFRPMQREIVAVVRRGEVSGAASGRCASAT